MKMNLKYINSVTDTEFSDNESKTKDEDNHEKQIQFQNSSKPTKIILIKETKGYDNSKATFLNKIENIETGGDEETPSLSALLADDEFSPIKLVNPNSDTNRTSVNVNFEYNKSSEKVKYTIADLANLEPIDLYQILDSIEDDGDLLVTDVIFSEVPAKQNSEILQLENELTKMRFNLISPLLDSASKQIELIRFIASSVGMQKHNNPRVFLFSYGLLIEQLIEFHMISRLKDQISVFILNALIEIIIKYCINCWKFETSKHEYLDRQFKEWKVEPFVPSKVKVYKYMVALLLTGYKTNLLGEVLVFFSTAPTPHLLYHILIEAEASNNLSTATKELLQYLKRQLMAEHLKCCGDPNKEKHWEFTSTSVPRIHVSESDKPIKVPNSEIINDKKRVIQGKSSLQKSTESECNRFPGSLSDCSKF